jgi:PAS domain-containing protein
MSPQASTTKVSADQIRRRRWLSWIIVLIAVAIVLIQGYRFEQLHKTSIAAASRGEMLKTIIDNIPTGIAVIDTNTGHIVEWSAAADKLTGWTRAEVLDQPITYLMPPDERPQHDLRLANPATKELLAKTPLITDCWIVSKNRQYIPMHIKIAATSGPSAWYLLMFDKPNQILSSGGGPQPSADPTTLKTFTTIKPLP